MVALPGKGEQCLKCGRRTTYWRINREEWHCTLCGHNWKLPQAPALAQEVPNKDDLVPMTGVRKSLY
jgi:ribosomal protein L37AE/L43A